MCSPAHVLLHQPHPARRLEVEPAAVEAHTLADDRHPRVVGLAPFKLDQAGRPLACRRTPDRSDEGIAFGQLRAADDGTLRAGFVGEFAYSILDFGRSEIAGGRVDEVAHKRGCFGKANHAFDLRRIAGNQDARSAFGLFRFRPESVEPMLAK